MIRGTAAVAFQRVIEAVVGFVMVPYTLHRLGTDQYGLWTLFFSVVAFMNLADLGFAASFNRHFVFALNNPDRDERYTVFSTGLAYQSMVALVVFTVGLLLERSILHFFPQSLEYELEAPWVWRAMLFILVLGFIGVYARALFYSTQRVAALAIVNITLALANVAVVVTVLESGWGLLGMAGGAVVVAFLRLAMVFSIGARGVDGWKVGISGIRKSTFKRLWSFGIKILFARIAEQVYFQFDKALLGRVLGFAYVTHYTVGSKAASTANQAPLIMLPVIEPAAAEYSSKGDTEHFSMLLLRSCKYFSLAAFGLAGFILVTANYLLVFWLGSVPQMEITLALRILVVAYLTAALTGPIRVSARAAGYPGWEAKTASMQAVLNIVFSIILYHLMGFMGVLLGTLFATMVGQSTLVTVALKGLKQSFIEYVKRAWSGPFFAAGIAAGITYLVKEFSIFVQLPSSRIESILPILMFTAVFGIVYFAIIFVLRVLTLKEISGIIDRVKRK